MHETFIATMERETFLSRLRCMWELIKETANPNTMHTEDLTEEQRRKLASFESFDYHKAYPDMYMAYLREHTVSTPFSESRSGSNGVGTIPLPMTNPTTFSSSFRRNSFSSVEKREKKNLIVRWLLHVAIAIAVSLMAALLAYAVDGLEGFRIQTLSSIVNLLRFRIVAQLTGYLFWLFTAVALMAVGTAVVVFIEPAAGGGGIPTVMAYLNGVNVRRAMNIKTFFVKAISCAFAVASGLPVGIEAPLVHLGAIVGAGVAQGGSQTLGIQTGFFKPFRNHHDRRAFMTAGAACGVSAAFGAPIGGLLFVMEEISSSWDHSGSGSIFLASMIAMTTTTMVNSLVEEGKLLGWVSHTASVLFEVNISIPFNLMSIIPALFLGAILGALAALFTKMNIILNKWRKKHIAPFLYLRFLEPLAVVAMYATLTYFFSWASDCRSIMAITEVNETILQWGTESHARLFSDTCKNQTAHYSPLGTLNMATGKNAIRHLFTRQTAGELPIPHLLVYFLLYTCFACISSGMCIASGLVVPSLVIGAAFGRLYGLILWYLFTVKVPSVERGYRTEDSWLDPGLFALIGAAAFLAGTSRLGMSVCVIVVELSSELRYLLPIMVAIVCSKAIANWLSEPLYHHILHLDCVPFLSPQIPSAEFEQLTAEDVMVPEVVALRRVEKTETIWKALQTTHHAFPVVEEIKMGFTGEQRYEEGDGPEDGDEEVEGDKHSTTLVLDEDVVEEEKIRMKASEEEDGIQRTSPFSVKVPQRLPHQLSTPRYRGGGGGVGTGANAEVAGLLTLRTTLSSSPTTPQCWKTATHSPPHTTPTTTNKRRRKTKIVHHRFVGLVTREDLQAYLALPLLSVAPNTSLLSCSSSGSSTPSPSLGPAPEKQHMDALVDKLAFPIAPPPLPPSVEQRLPFTRTPTTPSMSTPSYALLSSPVLTLPTTSLAPTTLPVDTRLAPGPPPPVSSPGNMTYREWVQHKHHVFLKGGGIQRWWDAWAAFFPGTSRSSPIPSSPTSILHGGSPTGSGGRNVFPPRAGRQEAALSSMGVPGRRAGQDDGVFRYRQQEDGPEHTTSHRSSNREAPQAEHRATGALLDGPVMSLPEAVDLSLIINRSPWVIPPFFNLFMAYKTFSMMGLRHMVVVDGEEVCGMITRKDLLPDALRRRLKELRYRLTERGLRCVDPLYGGGGERRHGRGGSPPPLRAASLSTMHSAGQEADWISPLPTKRIAQPSRPSDTSSSLVTEKMDHETERRVEGKLGETLVARPPPLMTSRESPPSSGMGMALPTHSFPSISSPLEGSTWREQGGDRTAAPSLVHSCSSVPTAMRHPRDGSTPEAYENSSGVSRPTYLTSNGAGEEGVSANLAAVLATEHGLESQPGSHFLSSQGRKEEMNDTRYTVDGSGNGAGHNVPGAPTPENLFSERTPLSPEDIDELFGFTTHSSPDN